MRNLKSKKARAFAKQMVNMVAQDEHGKLYAVGPKAHEIRFVKDKKGYITIHRINDEYDLFWNAHEFVAENIGSVSSGINSKPQEPRPIKPNEGVHHIDGDPSNNRPDNLIIMEKEKHDLHHCRTDQYLACKYGIPVKEFVETTGGTTRIPKPVLQRYRVAYNATQIRAFMDQQNAQKLQLESQQNLLVAEIYKAIFDAEQAKKCYKKKLKQLQELNDKHGLPRSYVSRLFSNFEKQLYSGK